MSELTLQERFALISLNAQDSLHMTTAKKAALRCVFAAQVLDTYIDSLWPSATILAEKLKASADLSSHELKQTESKIKEKLVKKHLIREVHNLLTCAVM